MENTPIGHADDLPTILGFVKNYPKSRSVNILSSNWILTQTVQKNVDQQGPEKGNVQDFNPVSCNLL